MAVKVVIAADKQELLDRIKVLIQQVADNLPPEQSFIKVGLSGGSMVNMLSNLLPGVKTDWTKWRFFFCDERLVPFDSSESTYGCYRSQLIPKLGLKEDQFVTVNPSLSPEEAAKDYVAKLATYFGSSLPEFDLLLLGMGPDGHTCSLFPGHKLLEERARWVAEITDSPKPPPCRVTLTLPVVNNAKLAVFPITGEEKAPTVLSVLHPKTEEEPLPASLVNPSHGDVIWLLDTLAASLLPK